MDQERYLQCIENKSSMIQDNTDQLPRIKSEIDSLIIGIKEQVLKYNPLQLLGQLELLAISTKSGITSECQQLDDESYAYQRAVEYVHSIYVSCKREDNEDFEDQDQIILNRIVCNIEQLYKLTSMYILLYGIQYRQEHKDDEALIDDIIELQMMYGVRGKRYQIFEKEYYSKLLFIHDQVFQECFNMSANDIVNGIEKLQYALSQGKLDGLNKIVEILREDEEKNEESTDLYELLKSHREELQEDARQILEHKLNDVCCITGWNTSFVEQLAFCIGEDTSFFSAVEYPGWPIIDMPIQKRPFIKIDESYYCFDYFSFVDNFYRAIQKMISRVKKTYQWSSKQQLASEEAVADIFQKLLPGCAIYQNNYYPVGRSLKQMCENDIIIQYYDILFVIEVKAGSFVYTAPITDFKQHIESYKKLIQEPDSQCKRTLDYIKDKEIAQFYNEDKTEKMPIDTRAIRDIYTFSITVDNINALAAKAEKISFLKCLANTICIAVDDLMIYKDYFDSPLIFLHYLKQRREATNNPQINLNDELDHLGMYIEHNCYALTIENESQPHKVYYMGYREKLDTYYGQLYHHELSPQKPQQKLLPFYNEIIRHLDASNIYNKIQISNFLLDFASDTREWFATSINDLYDKQSTTRKRSIITVVGESNKASYTCFVQQPGIEDVTRDEQVDYVLSTMAWFGETKRYLICIRFDQKKKIKDISLDELTDTLITDENKEKLLRMGEMRAREKLRKHRMIHGNKIPRNDLCPCGSGKKYKKCCENRL